MRITPLDFINCPLDGKISRLYEEGTFITSIRYYRHKINLYLLENFYVEVFVNHKLGKIEKISLLDSNHSRMKFYCDQIRLGLSGLAG
jgi:hypothetical protein